jgi:hypothetical protein
MESIFAESLLALYPAFIPKVIPANVRPEISRKRVTSVNLLILF